MRLNMIYATWNPQNRNDIYLNMMAAGREVGKCIRILFDFKLTEESREYLTQNYFSVAQ